MYNENNQDNFVALVLVCLAFAAFFLAAWATAPTEDDIKRCTEVSNYSYERCEFELTR